MDARDQRGQHTAEFGLLVGMTALIAVAMQPMIRKAISRGVQSATDGILNPVIIMATPETIDPDSGQTSTTLRWSVPRAVRCIAFGVWKADDPNPPRNWGWYELKPPSGVETIENITKTTTFRLWCDVPGGYLDEFPIKTKVTVTVGSLGVRATQDVDMTGRATTGFQTTEVDAISGTAVNQDIQTRQLPKE